MPAGTFAPSKLHIDYGEWTKPAIGSTDTGKAWVWNNATAKYEPAAYTPVAPGGSTTQVQYNNAGAFAGDAGMTYDAATDRLTVAGGLVAPSMRPASNSTTALQWQNAAGTAIVTVDTTNGRIKVGTAGAPGATIDVDGLPDAVPALRLVSQVNADLMVLTKSADGNIATIALTSPTGNGFVLTNTSTGTFLSNNPNYGYSSVLSHSVDAPSINAGRFSATQNRTAKGTNANLTIGIEASASSAITTSGVFGYAVRATASTKNITPLYARTGSGAVDSDAAAVDVVNSALTRLFGITPTGRLMINQAVTNTNTPSGTTAHAMPVYDIAGTLLGYMPIYASQW